MRRLLDRKLRCSGWCFLLWLCCITAGLGKHIYGGNMSLQATNRENYYIVTLTLYYDLANASLNDYQEPLSVYIFRKSDHTQVQRLLVNRSDVQQLPYDNDACAKLRNLNIVQVKYSSEIVMTPQQYGDPGGYYAVWERCCRNDATDNIQTPGEAGIVFYMEFPAVQRNGVAFRNSTPEFPIPNGEYICVGKSFKLNFGAVDADGDQLQYSLVTPLAGYTSASNVNGDGTSHTSYPPVQWRPGYSANTAIPGSPSLQINPQTGQLSVTATQAGLFIFAVQCVEYRNGVPIGVTRREFQLPVIECSKNTPSLPVISYQNQPATDLTLCPGFTFTLSTQEDPLWSYQWQRNGDNIIGATSSTLTVKEAGDYTVVKSFKQTCGNDTTSTITKIRASTAPSATITTGKPGLCEGDSVMLSLPPQPTLTYQWSYNGTIIPAATSATFIATQAGLYSVQAKATATGCTGRDSVSIALKTRPSTTISASSTVICQGSTVQLTTANNTALFRYQWYRNNAALPNDTLANLSVKQEGSYYVRLTNKDQCNGSTTPIQLTVVIPPIAQLDTLLPQCASNTQPITLTGNPTSGQLSGPGVSGNQFEPSKAGAGMHTITYTVSTSGQCPATATRQVRVDPPIVINLPQRIRVLAGDTLILKPIVNTNPIKYRWEPPAGLSDPSNAQPSASPLESTTYRLTVTSPTGCQATADILVEVLQRLFVSDTFTPNGDGVNDVLVIRNIEKFPNNEVLIYNRWGEIIYQSKGYGIPWDGMYLNRKVPPGIYLYVIKIGQELADERGSVLVLY